MNVMTLLYLIISLALTLPSCVAIPIQSNIPGQLPNMKAQIVIGESRRGDVRNELGQPFIVHNDVEIYRALKGSEWWVAGIILPTVPFGLDVIAYAMVAYDEDNIVKELEWGIFGTKDWGIYGERSEEITSHIELEVGEFVFLSEKCSVSIKHLKACEYLYLNQILVLVF